MASLRVLAAVRPALAHGHAALLLAVRPAFPAARRCFSTSPAAPGVFPGQPGDQASAPQRPAPEGDQPFEMSGASERGKAVGFTGGAPEEFVRRTCRIYKPSRSATQQGPEYKWKIEFDSPNKWVNPLMGWTSTRDTAGQLREMLWFDREEDAVGFAQREGFSYTILPYHSKHLKAKAFADNFKWKGPPKDQTQQQK